MLLVTLFLIFFLLPSYLAVAYYLGLVTARLLGCYDAPTRNGGAVHRLAVVIPAHNEANEIAAAVHSCFESDYPREQLQVVVVADNCQDATCEQAERAGARCLSRHAPALPGKGPALSWAFDQLLQTPMDALIVLDADCRLERDTLKIVDHCLQNGHRALQTNHRVTNADASPISYAAAVGRTLEYDLFFAQNPDSVCRSCW